MKQSVDCDGIMVVVAHSWGDIETTLEHWMQIEPGGRKHTTITRAFCKDDGRRLPLSIVPLKYRNNYLSRLLIKLRLLENPWAE